MNMPAARVSDSGTHPGSVIMPPGCPSVLIGLSGTTGNPRLGLADCQAAAAGRNPPPGTLDNSGNPVPSGTAQQSYNNCGVETSRLLINRARGTNLTQEGLLNWAMNNHIATQVPGNLFASGGTNPAGRAAILNQNNVPAHLEARNMANLEQSVMQGRGNIVTVDSSTLWSNGATAPSTGDHVVNVIGLEYDDNGDVTHVIITDTGTGNCQQRVPINVWNQATDPVIGSWQTVVTNNPLW
jgi:phosphoribosyl-AMP cyclohydrolase